MTQATLQGVSLRAIAFNIVKSLRIHAVSATFLALPTATSRA